MTDTSEPIIDTIESRIRSVHPHWTSKIPAIMLWLIFLITITLILANTTLTISVLIDNTASKF
jgi:hypothetical protein